MPDSCGGLAIVESDRVTVKTKEVIYQMYPVNRTQRQPLVAKERARALGIGNVIVASTTGSTGAEACEIFKGFNLVVVRHHSGFQSSDSQEMTPQNEKFILESGTRIITASHALSGVQ